MNPWTLILTYIGPAFFGAIGIGLSTIVGIYAKRWEARAKVKLAKDSALADLQIRQLNARIAIQAVDQMYATLSNEEKQKMGLQIAAQLNKKAGVDVDDRTQLPINEATVNFEHKLPRENNLTPSSGYMNWTPTVPPFTATLPDHSSEKAVG
jgi:hypothetical protein